MPLTRQRLFTRHRKSVPASREFVTCALTEWGYTEHLDEIRLCASEIATNALAHGVPPGRLFAVRVDAEDEQVRVEVRDSGTGTPLLRVPHLESESGRGLLLVQELTDAWGVVQHTIGKAVWFTVKVSPPSEGQGCPSADGYRPTPSGPATSSFSNR
ncbi:ATP-binding protein [Streptomyces sp. 8N706]|uniref:ATP-binding protein n=1 Tax=Streptomyces sp. 8N706 TaxID=3457416 RepID=UPI003FD17DF7